MRGMSGVTVCDIEDGRIVIICDNVNPVVSHYQISRILCFFLDVISDVISFFLSSRNVGRFSG